MKYVVNFSGGLCSFFAALRAVAIHGRENVILLFADTLIEDADLYAFNDHASKLLGIPITRISLEVSPWELFRREGMIANDHFPICSVKLKREPLNEWMSRNFAMDKIQADPFFPPATVVLGFDATEWNRVQDMQNAHPHWRVWAPMTDAPLWDKCRMVDEAKKLGFKTPRLYELGFPHNNCGGACVKAGISHFVHLYHVLPDVFETWEKEELLTQQALKLRGVSNWNFTILRDRRGGVTKPMTFQELRKRIVAGEKFPKSEWGGDVVVARQSHQLTNLMPVDPTLSFIFWTK